MSHAKQPPGSTSAIYAVSKARREPPRCAVNILPCYVHHDGPVNASKRYWNPTQEPDGHQLAYFRGRKLHGRKTRIPANQKGLILRKSQQVVKDDSLKLQAMHDLEARRGQLAPDEYEEEERELREAASQGQFEAEEMHIMDQTGSFDDVTVWGHDCTPPDADEDAFARGIEDWVAFAAALHAQA